MHNERKQKIHYSVWKRFVDGIYTCKDIEELLADKKTDRSKDFDEASACLWKTGEEESSSSWEEWISNERQALQIISNYEDRRTESLYLFSKKIGGAYCCGCIALHRFERSLFLLIRQT